MFEIFREEKLISGAMFVFFGLSVLVRILLGCLYGSMIRETDNMAVTKNKLLRQCKLKFINCYQLNNGVNNVPVFVDKFISRMALGPFSFESLYHLSGQSELLSVVCAGAGICKCIAEGKTIGQILPFYIACFAGLYLYFSVSSALDIKGKRRILKVNLVDYLENHLSSRIGTTRDDLEMLHYIKPGKKTIEFMPIGKRMEVLEPEEDPKQQETENVPGGELFAKEAEGKAAERKEAEEKKAPQMTGGWQNTAPESLITEEELEALLKEFLAI